MLDANHLPDRQPLTPPLCIVGAGAAGIAMALEFIGSGVQVLVLEAHGFNPASEAAYAVDSAAAALRRSRAEASRTVGKAQMERRGSRCLALTETELAPRAYVADSGWPLSAAQLAPYYTRALGLCESGASAFSARHDEIAMAQPLIAGLSTEPFCADQLDRYAPPEPLARRHALRLAAASNICMIGNAQVTALHLDADGRRIERLTVRTSQQRSLLVRPGIVVLAAGSEETARLLLASRDVHADGIGNSHGNVGRYCMSPLSGTIGIVRLLKPPAAIWHGPRRQQRSRRPLLLGRHSQLQLRLPAFAMRLLPATGDDLLSAALERFRRGANYLHSYRVKWHAEHYPAPDCRLLLDEARDRNGVPKARLDWHSGDIETAAVRRALGLFDQALRKSGVGRFDHDAGTLSALMTVGELPEGPLVGGARMGRDPRQSVVDPDGRVHDLDNLYVTGTAAFVTSGIDSPLLTAVALGQRLADHLRQQVLARPATLSSLKRPREAGARDEGRAVSAPGAG